MANRVLVSGLVYGEPKLSQSSRGTVVLRGTLEVREGDRRFLVPFRAVGDTMERVQPALKRGARVLVEGRLSSFETDMGTLLVSVLVTSVEVLVPPSGVQREAAGEAAKARAEAAACS